MGEMKEKVAGECSYPSDVDNMMRNDTPFEGTANSLPSENPIPGADGTLPTQKISKLK